MKNLTAAAPEEALIYSMKNKSVLLYAKPSCGNSMIFEELREMVRGNDV
jgi:hypothetical protein